MEVFLLYHDADSEVLLISYDLCRWVEGSSVLPVFPAPLWRRPWTMNQTIFLPHHPFIRKALSPLPLLFLFLYLRSDSLIILPIPQNFNFYTHPPHSTPNESPGAPLSTSTSSALSVASSTPFLLNPTLPMAPTTSTTLSILRPFVLLISSPTVAAVARPRTVIQDRRLPTVRFRIR